MRSTTDRVVRIGAVLLLTAACTSPAPSPSAPASDAAPSASPTAAASDGLALDPGQPFSGSDILDAMRASPRPGGVPDELQTDAIASAIADEIWTFDGNAWDTTIIGASCASDSCVVEVAGSRSGAEDDDLWIFAVVQADGGVAVESTELGALPASTVGELDELARSLVDQATLDGMLLTAATWEPPPDGDRYTLSYRSGGEEGSCGAEIVVDAARRTLVDERPIGDC